MYDLGPKDKIINRACPDCKVPYMTVAIGWKQSKENPVNIPWFIYCDHCSHQERWFKKYTNLLEDYPKLDK